VHYLDWNATTPPHPDVVEAMQTAARSAWGNPSSLHATGRKAKAVVEDAREAVAELVGLSPRDVVLTSGGTEANNLGILRPFGAREGAALGLCVTSRLEHPSVTAVAELLERRGVRVAWLDTPASGRIDPEDVDRALAQRSEDVGPRLVAMSAVNHETGVLQPVAEVAQIAEKRGAELHVDAVQAAGRLAPGAWQGAHSVALAAHKMRGPKGIGALVVRAGIAVRPILLGGAQERGLRPGTVDPVAAAGFGVAARRAQEGPERYARLASLRGYLEEQLIALGARLGKPPLVNGTAARAPHVSNMSWPGWAGDELVAALDLEGVCVSAGSACAAGTPEPSRVIAAMLGEERARTAVRASLGEETTRDVVEETIAVFERVLRRRSSR
jgi:cysteine desulfurase